MSEWKPAPRYPDPAIESLDARFDRLRIGSANVERLSHDCRWSEGPVWLGDVRALVWSDIPNDRILRWDEETGEVTSFRRPSHFANGNTRDREGRLVTCEHGARRVTRTEHDGRITILCERFDGKRLNSPNDVVVKSDGSIWFTDPPFGILSDYEGERAPLELPHNVYRIDGSSGAVTVAAAGIDRPNGLAFSPDERLLYLVECGTKPRRIHAFDVADAGQLGNPRVLIDAGEGAPDGLRVDEAGNLWCGWGGTEALDGVRIFAPTGEAIGHIHLPERCANVCFGGLKRNRLFMAASHSLYALYVNTRGMGYAQRSLS
jgi:gluconolactonase